MGIYERFKNLSVGLKIGLLVGYFLFTISGMLATVYYFHAQSAQEGERINVAGAQRMLSQRMTKQALAIARGDDSLRADLRRSIEDYDFALRAIEQGGAARGYILPPVPTQAKAIIAFNEEFWRDFKPRIEAVAREDAGSSDFAQSLNYVLENEGELLLRSDAVVVALAEISNERFDLRNRILLAFLGLAFIVAFLAYFPYQKVVVEPIVALADRARRIGVGDLKSSVVGVERGDEIGTLAKSLEKTIMELDDFHSNLAKKVEERTQQFEKMNMILREQARELRRINELKELFADIMRHDLTNHVSVIRGALDLWGGDVSPENRELFRMMQENAQRIERIIRDATVLSKMENTDSLDYAEADIWDCIKDAGKNIQSLADEKNIELIWNLDDGHVIPFHKSMAHVFTNLLSNAVKFSPENSKVQVSIEDRGDLLRIAVKDQGPGVPDEHKKSIFERFVRRAKEGVAGTGLGLAIARRVVELHHGRIWVEDNPGGGSIFYVELPKKQPH